MNNYIAYKEELLKFLFDNVKEYNKKEIKNFLKYKSILVNDKIITKHNYMLKDNDIVKINIYNKNKNIEILYEDKDLIAVNKESGILVVDNETNKNKTLYNLVSEYVKKNNKNNKIFIIHRLDQDTSGIVVFAKNEKIKKILQDNWNEIVLTRKYIAIVEGNINESGVIKNYLTENKNHFVYVSNKGKLAITEYKKIKSNEKYSWVDINLKTGRKNQIRVHFKSIGHPVVGDIKYGNKNEEYNRLCLHAYELSFINPINNKKMVFTSPIPKKILK
ncbi:MAG: RluA family pseudouridine synthase [Firmicutes bacterium]|nr:RluA family pseudouridine synthase [Bacillota bacterium]